MRATTAALLVLFAISCGGEKKNAESKTSTGETSPSDENKAISTESKAPMEDTVTTVDIGYERGKITLTVPAGWVRGTADQEEFSGPTWYHPETPDVRVYRLRIELNSDGIGAAKTFEAYVERRVERDKKFAGNKYSGDELLDPENTIGRTFTPLANEAFPGGWLWAYEVTYNEATAGLLQPNFGVYVWLYEPDGKQAMMYSVRGHSKYKAEYYDKLVEIGKSIKIGN